MGKSTTFREHAALGVLEVHRTPARVHRWVATVGPAREGSVPRFWVDGAMRHEGLHDSVGILADGDGRFTLADAQSAKAIFKG